MTSLDRETFSWIHVLLSFAIVLGLMSLLALALRFVAKRGFLMTPGSAGKSKRLQVMDSLSLDVRRRLIIVRQDNREHLLLLGNDKDVVVASWPGRESDGPTDPKSAP